MGSFFGGRDGLLGGIFVIFLLLGCTYAQDGCVIKQVTDDHDPTGNLNLSPVWQWRSARECLQNVTCSCAGKFNLTENGLGKIESSDTVDYCTKGCAKHTRAVLFCISRVHRHYTFTNGATVKDVNNTINDGCLHGFNGTLFSKKSSAWKMYESKTTTLISAVAAWIFISFMTI